MPNLLDSCCVMKSISTIFLLTLLVLFVDGTRANDLAVAVDNSIPKEFQVECGTRPSWTCDNRTEFCSTSPVIHCEDCADDICAFVAGKDFEETKIQCQELCPLYWKTIEHVVTCQRYADECRPTSTPTSSTVTDPDEPPDCHHAIEENAKLTADLASERKITFGLTVSLAVCGLALVGFAAAVVTLVYLFREEIRAKLCAAKPRLTGDYEKVQLRREDPGIENQAAEKDSIPDVRVQPSSDDTPRTPTCPRYSATNSGQGGRPRDGIPVHADRANETPARGNVNKQVINDHASILMHDSMDTA